MKHSYLLPIFLGLSIICQLRSVAYGDDIDSVRLLVRTPVVVPEVSFTNSTQSWINQQSEIRVAIWGDAWPPMYLGSDYDYFEGVTADVLGVLEQMLRLRFKIVRYAGREQAIQGLVDGKVDMLAFNDTGQPSDSRIRQSVDYLVNRRVIVRRASGFNKTISMTDKERLAYVGSPILEKQLEERYPLAKLMNYRSRAQAIAAVFYGQADAMYTSSTTAAYLIPQMFPNLLYFDHIKEVADIGNLNFAVNAKNLDFLDAINRSLSAIPLSEMLRIASRWELSEDFIIPRESLQLSEEEQAWVTMNPEIKVVISALDAPFTFYDKAGQLHGLSVDLLKQIEHSTGLSFEFTHSTGNGDMVSRIKNHEADLVVTLSAINSGRGDLLYTRSYLTSPLVMVTKRERAEIDGREEFSGRRVAVVRHNTDTGFLDSYYPNITAVIVDNAYQGLEMLVKGEVDGSVQNQFIADYFIKQYFSSDLRISSAFGPSPDKVVMAVHPSKQILRNIINKALLNIHPERLTQLIERWRNHNAPAVASPWSIYKNVLYIVVSGAVLLTLAFLLWNYYLRDQIRRRQRAEEALKDQLEFTRTLIDGSPIALYVLNSQERLIHCNQAYLDFMQASRDDLIGNTLKECGDVVPWLTENYDTIYLPVVSTGQPVFSDLAVEVKGQLFHIYHWVLPFQDGMGRYQGVIGGWLDITEHERLLQQVRQAKELAEQANRTKSVFLTTMSHEIRTPISAVVGLIELLRLKTNDPQKMAQNLDVAYQSAQSLLALIGDILDLSKIEAGALEPSSRVTDLDTLIRNVHRLFEANARKKNLEYSLCVDVTHRGVMIDSLMLNQIISNLLSNAIKFTEIGEVKLSLHEDTSSSHDGESIYEIQVQDSGIGLSYADQKVIFEPFVQVGNVRQQHGGTGLGLSICQRLAELLGATLSVESRLEKGSCFSLRFRAPLAQLDAQLQQASLQRASEHRLRVLVAEDHAPSRLLLCQQLEYLGHEVVPCDDGSSALDTWVHAFPPFDLTIADCNMPNIDGFELSERIRVLEEKRGGDSHPIFGLTANAQSSVIDRGLSAGMTKCLFKPVSIDELSRLIDEVSRRHGQQLKIASADSELDKIRIIKPEAYGNLVKEILRAIRDDSIKLVELRDDCNLKELGRLAHKIKGGAQLTGDTKLVNACQELEDCADVGAQDPGVKIGLVLNLLNDLQTRLIEDQRKD